MDAFDADALIYAAVPGHPLGLRVAALFRRAGSAGAGSVLLLPEVLSKPLRDGTADEVRVLAGLLARLDLRPVDRATAELATALSSRYRLKAADATHLATAVGMGADRFITNNKRDFGTGITEIDVIHPDDASPRSAMTAGAQFIAAASAVGGGGQRVATSACLARTASAAVRRAASSASVRSRSTTRRTPVAPISASTPR